MFPPTRLFHLEDFDSEDLEILDALLGDFSSWNDGGWNDEIAVGDSVSFDADYWDSSSEEFAVGAVVPRSQPAIQALNDFMVSGFVNCVKDQGEYLKDPIDFKGFMYGVYNDCYKDQTRKLDISPKLFRMAVFKTAKNYAGLFGIGHRFDEIHFQGSGTRYNLVPPPGEQHLPSWQKHLFKKETTDHPNWLTFGNDQRKKWVRINHGARETVKGGKFTKRYQRVREPFRFSIRFVDTTKINDMVDTIFNIVSQFDFITWFKILPRTHFGRDDVVFGVTLPETRFVTQVTVLPHGDHQQLDFFQPRNQIAGGHVLGGLKEPTDADRAAILEMGARICEAIADIMQTKPGIFSSELPPFQWKPCPVLSGADYKEGQSFGVALSSAFSFFPTQFQLGSDEGTALADEVPAYRKCASYAKMSPAEKAGLHLGAPDVWNEVKESCLSITLDAWVFCQHPVPQTWYGTWPVESTRTAPDFDERCIQPMLESSSALKRTKVQPLVRHGKTEVRIVVKPPPGESNANYANLPSSAYADGKDPSTPRNVDSIGDVREIFQNLPLPVDTFTDADLPDGGAGAAGPGPAPPGSAPRYAAAQGGDGDAHVELQVSSDSEEYH